MIQTIQTPKTTLITQITQTSQIIRWWCYALFNYFLYYPNNPCVHRSYFASFFSQSFSYSWYVVSHPSNLQGGEVRTYGQTAKWFQMILIIIRKFGNNLIDYRHCPDVGPYCKKEMSPRTIFLFSPCTKRIIYSIIETFNPYFLLAIFGQTQSIIDRSIVMRKYYY